MSQIKVIEDGLAVLRVEGVGLCALVPTVKGVRYAEGVSLEQALAELDERLGRMVMGVPTVELGKLYVGRTGVLTLHGQSYLVGGSIARFRVWLRGVEQGVVAVDNAGTLNFEVGAQGALEIAVRAVDGYGHESVLVRVQAEVLGVGSRLENKATLIGPYTWNGEQKYVAVLDAAYRSAAPWGKSGMDTLMPNVAATWGAVSDWSEAALEECAQAETQNSQQNMDTLLTLNTGTDSAGNVGTPAAAYCHEQSLMGQSCQLPSLKVLLRIYKEREFLDAHDPSVEANPGKALSQWGFNPPNEYVFSSSEYSRSAAVALSRLGEIQAYQKFNACGLVPVLEL